MYKLILASAVAAVAIAAPGLVDDSIAAELRESPSSPELKTIDPTLAGQYLGRIYAFAQWPSLLPSASGESSSGQPVVYTGYSAPEKYISIPNIWDYISYYAKPWTSWSVVQNNTSNNSDHGSHQNQGHGSYGHGNHGGYGYDGYGSDHGYNQGHPGGPGGHGGYRPGYGHIHKPGYGQGYDTDHDDDDDDDNHSHGGYAGGYEGGAHHHNNEAD